MSGISFAQSGCEVNEDCLPRMYCDDGDCVSFPNPGEDCYKQSDCGCNYCSGANGIFGTCGDPLRCGIPTGVKGAVPGGCPSGCTCSPSGNDGSVCVPLFFPSSGESCKWYDMIATVDVSCEENVVSVTANQNPLEGAEVKVLKFYSTKFSGKTNSSGQYEFNEQNGMVQILLSNLYKGNNCYRAPSPLDVTLKTSEECAPKPECTRDSDCPTNYVCSNNECSYVAPPPPPPPPTQPPECTSDADCPSDKFCSEGKCAPVTGTCGYAADHTWNAYECCADKDCPANNVCENNKCKPHNYDLQGDDSGFVGDNNTVTAYLDGSPLAGAQLKVTKPDGSSELLTTDADGLVMLSLLQEGTYTIDLLVDGVVKSFEIVSLPKTPVQPPEEPSTFDVIAQNGWLLLLLILVGAGLVYWYTTGNKKKK